MGKEVKEIHQLRVRYDFTQTEAMVIQSLLTGASHGDIGRSLGLSERTVKTHITNIYNKLAVYNKAGLLKKLKDFNLIPDQAAEKKFIFPGKFGEGQR